MTNYLLDTSVLLLLVRAGGIGNSLRSAYRLDDPIMRPLVSIVSHGEIRVLADRNRWGPDKQKTLQDLLDSLATVRIDAQAIVDAYVELALVSQRHAEGARAISDNDLWIAATTKAAGAVLLTADKDFLHFHPQHLAVEFIDQGSPLP